MRRSCGFVSTGASRSFASASYSHLAVVLDAVSQPDHAEPDLLPDRTRFYRRNVGPSRWLLAVVSYEQKPARIITALANRKDPKQWKP